MVDEIPASRWLEPLGAKNERDMNLVRRRSESMGEPPALFTEALTMISGQKDHRFACIVIDRLQKCPQPGVEEILAAVRSRQLTLRKYR